MHLLPRRVSAVQKLRLRLVSDVFSPIDEREPLCLLRSRNLPHPGDYAIRMLIDGVTGERCSSLFAALR